MPALTTIGFDADDTLWHNERFFQLTEARFREMLADHADADLVSSRLLEAERRNLGHYGFGIKGFVLSMIETALDVTGDTASPAIVRQILDAGREMLEHPVEALPEACSTRSANSRLPGWATISTRWRSSATRRRRPMSGCSPAMATGRPAP